MASFSAETKAELCRTPLGDRCCRFAELYGLLLLSSAFGHNEIRASSTNSDIMERLILLIRQVFGIDAQTELIGRKRVLSISEPEPLRTVLNGFGYETGPYVAYHLNRNVLENDCCAAAFLRGAFLAGGTVAGPDKKSHLELKVGHGALARELTSLMLDCGVAPGCTERAGTSMLYLKDGSRIKNLLHLIGADDAARALMEAKVEKQLRNSINRQVNCETANIAKTSAASQRQIAAIEQALAIGGIEVFPEHLRETVDLRVAYPELSLAELAARFEPPISKPGLDHRLKRILQIAEATV